MLELVPNMDLNWMTESLTKAICSPPELTWWMAASPILRFEADTTALLLSNRQILMLLSAKTHE
jgi:hypothetical protein